MSEFNSIAWNTPRGSLSHNAAGGSLSYNTPKGKLAIHEGGTSDEVIEKKYALEYDGVDDYVYVDSPYLSDIQRSGVVSYEIRFYYEGEDGVLLHRGTSANSSISAACKYAPRIKTNQVTLNGCSSSGMVALISPSIGNNLVSFVLNAPNNIASVYLNGVHINSVSPSGYDTIYDWFYIGAGNKGGVNPGDSYISYNGRILETRIWGTAIPQQQILDNMNDYLNGGEPGLEAYYPMNEGEGDTIYDQTGNDNHGTIYGATWVEYGN